MQQSIHTIQSNNELFVRKMCEGITKSLQAPKQAIQSLGDVLKVKHISESYDLQEHLLSI